MAFQPFVPGTGLAAWRVLQRTMPTQLELFSASSEQKRLTDRFLEAAPDLKSAQTVVSDRQLLSVALGAYGLQDDLENRFFIRKVLEDGSTAPDALANRLTDSRYKRMAEDFAFDGVTGVTGIRTDVAEDIASLFNREAFAVAIGETQPSLRLALGAEVELSRIANSEVSDDAKWYLVMGNPPLRAVVEKALGVPTSVGRLDLDQQLGIFREQSAAAFGESEVAAYTDVDLMGQLIDRFLLREQVSQGTSLTSSNIALTLLGA